MKDQMEEPNTKIYKIDYGQFETITLNQNVYNKS